MPIDPTESAVFKVTSADTGNSAFGTAFAIAHVRATTWLLTCAHVLHQVKRPVVDTLPARPIADGAERGIDLAVLAVDGLADAALLSRWIEGREGDRVHTRGYSRIDPDRSTTEKRRLDGRLGQHVLRQQRDHPGEARVWDLEIGSDDFSRLKLGFSGAPLYDDQHRVVAVVSERYGGDRGHAVCLSNLQRLDPALSARLPRLAGPGADPLDPKELLTRLTGAPILPIMEVFSIIGPRLQAMSVDDPSDANRAILARTAQYLAIGAEDAADFIAYCRDLDQTRDQATAAPDYAHLARRLAAGKLVLCLGPDLPGLAAGTAADALAEAIGARAGIDPKVWRSVGGLPTLGEYIDLATRHERDELVGWVQDAMQGPGRAHLPLFQLLADLPEPFVCITTCWSALLEAALRGAGRAYALIAPSAESGGARRLRLIYSDGRPSPSPFLSEELASHAPQDLPERYCLIYRLRGQVFPDHDDSLLLTEGDYLDGPLTGTDPLPDYLVRHLKTGLCYLGHHLHGWEDRLLARTLQQARAGANPKSALVIQPDPDAFTEAFWRFNAATIYPLDPDRFVADLGQALAAQRAADDRQARDR